MWLFQIFSVEAMLSIAVLGAFALIWGGVTQIRRGGEDRRRGWLMIVAAIVLLGNVLILGV